jgi:hypothetical protein
VHDEEVDPSTTIHQLPGGEVGMVILFLGGNGHFRYHGIACSSVKKYFEDEGEQIQFF